MAVRVEMIKPPIRGRDHGQHFTLRVAPGHGVQFAADVAGHPDDVFHQPRHILEYVMVDALQDIIRAFVFAGRDQKSIMDMPRTEGTGSGKSPIE